jgi:glutathione S-transferase
MDRLLVTIGMSHYCEKARWAVDRAGLPYREEAHVPLLHIRPVRRAGGQRGTPVLVDGGKVIADSTDILDHIDAHREATFRPWDGRKDGEVGAWEARLDADLGPHTRRFVYFHLLPLRHVLPEVASRFASPGELAWTRRLRPIILWGIRTTLKVDERGAERSRIRIEGVWEEVARTLQDGRRYLTGDRFTAADLTFAALAAPITFPDRYGGWFPHWSDVPPALKEAITAWRARPAGQFALRLYAEDRDPLLRQA